MSTLTFRSCGKELLFCPELKDLVLTLARSLLLLLLLLLSLLLLSLR